MLVLAAAGSSVLEPLLVSPWLKWLVIVAGYAVALGGSSWVVRCFVAPPKPPAPPVQDPLLLAAAPDAQQSIRERQRIGNIIGKCENIIILTFVLAKAETGLALIFAAKALVRREDIEHDPGYFLGGTLVNFVWSLLVAMAVRVLIAGL